MEHNFAQLSAAFLEEFLRQKDGTFHKHLQITDLRGQARGRGIIATADIPGDTELFTIPRDYVISVENSRLFQQLPQIFEDSNDDIGEGDEEVENETDVEIEDGSLLPKSWLDLILVLIHDYLHSSTSQWRAYWDVLPTSFDTLMFWSDEELDQLQASSVRGRIGKTSADNMFKLRIIPLIKRHESIFYPDSSKPKLDDEQLLTLCHRMGSLIMAYAFDLQTSNDEDENNDSDHQESGGGAEDGWAEDTDVQTAMGMVPMADLLNADAEFNAHLEHGETHLTMRSLRTIKAGEEVLNYYGPLGNGDLARRYGYTSSLHSRYDVVEISWDAVVKAMEEHFGTKLDMQKLSDINDDDDDDDEDLEEIFVLERETGDPDETGRFTSEAKLTTFPEELIDQVTALASAVMGIKKDQKSSEGDKKKLKQAFLHVMAQVVSSRLAEYSTSIEDDETLLRSNGLTGRLKMAVDIRLGEKKLLQEAAVLVQDLLQKYNNTERTGDREPPQKKQKRAK